MAPAGKVVGYFFALLVLVSALPLILLLIRMWRRHYSSSKNDLFELQLARSAKEAKMQTQHSGVEKRKKTISAGNLLLNVKQGLSTMRDKETFAADDANNASTDVDLEHNSTQSDVSNVSFQAAMKDQHAYFGIRDIFIKGGIIQFFSKSIFFPPGLLEDFIFYACNNINPLPFLFSDEENPTSLLSRYVVYCNSQVFTLAMYLIVDEDYQLLMTILISPVVLIFEFWLNRLIACPCLQGNNGYNNKQQQNQTKGEETCEVWGKRILRVIGGVLSLPLLLVMIMLLIVLSFGLANGNIHGRLLGRFVFDGILLPFFIKVFLVSFSFCYKLHPHHVNICGVNVFKINHWTELQFIEEDISHHHDLTAEEIEERRHAHWKKSYGEASIFHMNCYYLRYIGLPTDPNYRIDVCHPSCYCARCCNAISEMYWSVPDHASQYPLRKLQHKKLPSECCEEGEGSSVECTGYHHHKHCEEHSSNEKTSAAGGDSHVCKNTMEERLIDVNDDDNFL